MAWTAMITPKSVPVNPRQSASSDAAPIRLAGSVLDPHHHCHICAFFNSAEEEYEVLLPYIKEGIDRGEKALHVVDPQLREAHLRRLKLAGIDADAAEKSGQLDLRSWTETHLPGGEFDGKRTLEIFDKAVEESKEAGYSLIRLVTQMGWAKNGTSRSTLLEYEAKTNSLWLNQTGPVNPVICTYDLREFSGETVIDIMRTHPKVIIGGCLQENPFYVPAEQFIRELQQRGAAKLA